MKKSTLTVALIATIMIGCGGGGNSKDQNGSGDQTKSGIDTSKIVQRGKILYNTSSEITTTSADFYSKMTTTGEKRLVFTNFGKKMIEEKTEDSAFEMRAEGQTYHTTSSNHDLTKTINFVSYDVDFENQKIRKTDYSEAVNALMRPGVTDALGEQFKDANLTDEVIGSENILGYPCEIHEMTSMHAKTCYYKNIPLKMVIDDTYTKDGVTVHKIITEEASNIDLDHEPAESEYTLPYYPISAY